MKSIEKWVHAFQLKPKVHPDQVDVYLQRGINALKAAKANPHGFFRVFQRYPGAIFFGREEFLHALASVVGAEAAKEIVIYAAPEGYELSRHETAMTLEGPVQSLMYNETLLHWLSTGTRFRTLAEEFPGDELPWMSMAARYLSYEDLALQTRAFAERGIVSTIPALADRVNGTESHAQLISALGYRLSEEIEAVIASETKNPFVAASIRATIAFYLANPGVPLYVLGDIAPRSEGCFEVFRATRATCDKLGIPLVGGRMDISKADLNDVPIIDVAAFGDDNLRGMKPEVVAKVRQKLDDAGYDDFKIVVSSGIKLEQIGEYVEAGAYLVGIGEQAAYYLNQGQCNFTSDLSGIFIDGKLMPASKEGRELWRIVKPEILENAESGVRIADHLEQINLCDYLPEEEV
jgi:hypothetical protein